MFVGDETVRLFVLDRADDRFLRITPVGRADAGGVADFRAAPVGGDGEAGVDRAAVRERRPNASGVAFQSLDA